MTLAAGAETSQTAQQGAISGDRGKIHCEGVVGLQWADIRYVGRNVEQEIDC